MNQALPTIGEQVGFWRRVAPTPQSKMWRVLYSMCEGIAPDDARFDLVTAALNVCDAAGADLGTLRQAAVKVKTAVLA